MIRETGLALVVAGALYAGSGVSSVPQLYAQDKSQDKKEEQQEWKWADAKRINLFDTLGLGKDDSKIRLMRDYSDLAGKTTSFVCCYNGDKPNGTELYVKDADSFLTMMVMRKLAPLIPESRLFVSPVLPDGECFNRPGIWIYQDNKSIDHYPGERLSSRDDTTLSVTDDLMSKMKAWATDYANLRFFGREHWPRHLDHRKLTVTFDTSNPALKIAQKLTNEAKFDAARAILKREFTTENDIAVSSLLEGIMDIHEKLRRWRNTTEDVDVGKVLDESRPKFDIAMAAGYKEKALESLFDQGVIVYDKKCLKRIKFDSAEGAMLTRFSVVVLEDKAALRRIAEVSADYSRDRKKPFKMPDFAKLDFKKAREKGTPDFFVVGSRTFSDDSSRHYSVHSTRDGKIWQRGITVVEKEKEYFYILGS